MKKRENSENMQEVLTKKQQSLRMLTALEDIAYELQHIRQLLGKNNKEINPI